jgi:hypothetical protein
LEACIVKAFSFIIKCVASAMRHGIMFVLKNIIMGFGGCNVKRLVLAMLILFIGFMVLSQVFAADLNDRREQETRSRTARHERDVRSEARAGAKSFRQELDFLADPNTIRAQVQDHEGLEKALAKVTKGGLKEGREWGRGRVEERIELADLVHKQVVDELVFLRQVAVEEGALKTAAATEALVLGRQERFEKVFGRLERSMRRAERSGRGRGRGRRDSRYRYREPGGNQQAYDERTYRNGQRDR